MHRARYLQHYRRVNVGSGGDFLGTAQTERESPQSPAGVTELSPVRSRSVRPPVPKNLTAFGSWPGPASGPPPHVPGDLPPTPGAGGPHGPGSSNNGPSSSRFLFVAWRRRRHHPGRHDIHSGYGASRGTGEEKGVDLSKPTCLAPAPRAPQSGCRHPSLVDSRTIPREMMPFPQTLSWLSLGGVRWKEKNIKGVGKVIPTNRTRTGEERDRR